MHEVLDHSFFGNTIQDYLVALGILFAGLVVVFVFKKYIFTLLKRWADSTASEIDDLLVRVMQKAIVPALYFAALYIALQSLHFPRAVERGIDAATLVIVTAFAARAIATAAEFVLRSYLRRHFGPADGEKQLRGVGSLINIVIWALALVFVLDNLGVKISAVVAGLGIGGVAVALGAQTVLRDLFAYFVIFFDKPFMVGDFLVIEDKMGSVEYVGIKNTRLRALGGELLIFSNADLTNSRVHNYGKMEKRRVLFRLGVTYQTPAEKLKAIPHLVRDIILAQPDTTFDRGHFASYGDSSLDFEFVYLVTGPDYNQYMDIQHAINLGIFEAFAQEGIDFAYPSRTLFVNKIN